MNGRMTLSLIAALVVAFAAAHAYGATPLTLERHLNVAERVAPPYPTVPGRTLCVCQAVNDFSATYLGYLNSFTYSSFGDVTVNVVCAYPVFTPGPGTTFCSIFEVIK